mmetsp:Transcript_10695/g.9416  ORF Transcript_10695/g.9416 Transcript_10695/m.9416 type:complete len:111 (+) Transcript_10695:489-821(+)
MSKPKEKKGENLPLTVDKINSTLSSNNTFIQNFNSGQKSPRKAEKEIEDISARSNKNKVQMRKAQRLKERKLPKSVGSLGDFLQNSQKINKVNAKCAATRSIHNFTKSKF